MGEGKRSVESQHSTFRSSTQTAPWLLVDQKSTTISYTIGSSRGIYTAFLPSLITTTINTTYF
jgi:hypothetical protein